MFEGLAEKGQFGPDELALLGRVFDATCRDGETKADRESRASRILANYMAGIRDEAELGVLSLRPLGR